MPGGPAYHDCTDVTEYCTVEQTIYGYYPNLGANIFYLIWFSIFLCLTCFQAFKYTTWFYNWWIAFGAAGELAGYAGRIAMHYNPWNDGAFEDQISTLIFSPSFFAAAIYLTLKHMVRAVGTEYSPIRPSFYPWFFITCDFISLLLQAAGGGVASGAKTDKVTREGGRIMLAGICFQVATFTFLYGLVALFIWNMYRKRSSIKPEVTTMLRSRDFRIFASGILLASVAIYIRCIYRIVELAGGWANSVMRDEVDYIILDGMMCAIAVMMLVIAHPGKYFRCMVNKEYPAGSYMTEKQIDSETPNPELKAADSSG